MVIEQEHKHRKASLPDIERLAGRIKDNWSLCQLFEGTRRASEAEMMVAQTIHAAIVNQKKHGEPFSFRGDGVFGGGGGGLVDNATAYGMLLDRAYFVEETRGDKTVIFITQKLLDFIDGYYGS